MRILEQTEDVLTLQNLAIDFWFGLICCFFGCPPMMILSGPMMILSGMFGGLSFLFSFLFAGLWCIAVQQIWASDVVKNCSFNKTLNRVTIEFHGLQPKAKVLRFREIQRVEVRKNIKIVHGTVIPTSQLWLVTKYAEAIPLSEEYHNYNDNIPDSLKDITTQIRKILSLSRH